jgi:hypothetical protein
MRSFQKTLILLCGIAAIISSVAYIVSNTWKVSPIQISITKQPMILPNGQVWTSALQQQLSPAEFEKIVKAHPEGRDFALSLFAYNEMTNHVRILIQHGADTSDKAMEALSSSGLSNAVSLIRWVASNIEPASSSSPAR